MSLQRLHGFELPKSHGLPPPLRELRWIVLMEPAVLIQEKDSRYVVQAVEVAIIRFSSQVLCYFGISLFVQPRPASKRLF